MAIQALDIESLLMSKQPVMHLPVLSFYPGAVGGLGCFEGLLVHRGDGKVAEDIFHFAGCNVVPLDLWKCLTDVPRTEGTLVIGELDERHRSLRVALEGVPVN